MNQSNRGILFSTLAILFSPCVASAGTITGTTFIGGPGGTASVPAVLTISEGNDNQPGGVDNNIVVPQKVFDTIGVIDIEFEVRDSAPAGTTEYRLVESVDNDTGIDWSSYEMRLGFGVGDLFVDSVDGDGLDFDFPDLDPLPPHSSSAFQIIVATEDNLVFSGGIQSSGAAGYDIRIDVPDGITGFTLRQMPVPVPEPGSVVLALLTLPVMLRAWRRLA